MKIVNNLSEVKEDIAVAIGNFDGVHKGHQFVLNKLKQASKKGGYKSCLISFIPHPRFVFQGKDRYLLNSYNERRELIENFDIDYLVELPFTRDFSSLEPNTFLEKYLLTSSLKHFCLGHDFSFGVDRKGDFDLACSFFSSKNVVVEKLEPYFEDGELISSSVIRNQVLNNEFEKVTQNLSRPFFLSGQVVKGAGRGKEIGFPTANLKIMEERLVPSNGVYVTRIERKGGSYVSITNIGMNPTFSDTNGLNVETHILDFDHDIYGEELKVFFYKKIRDEKKFNSVNDLIKQINDDIEERRSHE